MAWKFNPETGKRDYYEPAGVASNGLPVGGTTDQVLSKIDATDFNCQWVDPSAGSGDVVGPGSAVDSNFAAFNTTTGKLIKDSGYSNASFDSSGAAGAVQSNLTAHEGVATGVHGVGGSTIASTANITTHAGVTSSVHGFDSSGNAPAQSHDNTRHSTAYAPDADLTTAEKQLYNVMSTGSKKGGAITVNGTLNYRFDLSAGSGVVVNNYTDADAPTVTNVSWSAFTNQTLTYLATDDETVIAINSSGAIVQFNTQLTEDQLHDYIFLGTIGHFSRTKIDYIIMEPNRITNVMQQLQAYWESFGPFNVNGNEFTANGANMKLNKSGGNTFDNSTGTAKAPNILSSDAGTAVYFQYYYQSSPNVWAYGNYTDTIDDLKYDSGSGLSTVAVGKFTIQTIFFYAPLWVDGVNGEYSVDIQYGQVVYDTLVQAQQAITNSIKFNPYLAYDTFRTWLIVKRGTTSLQSATDAMFIQAPPLKFGTMAATGGGSSGEANTASNVGTAGVGLYYTKTGVDLQFKNAEAASSKISIADYPTNTTVRFDVVEANIVHNSISGGTATVSVHGFDSSGNAPAQTHGNSRHSSAYLVGSGTAVLTVGTTAPGSPTTGDLWVDTN